MCYYILRSNITCLYFNFLKSNSSRKRKGSVHSNLQCTKATPTGTGSFKKQICAETVGHRGNCIQRQSTG